MLKTASNKEKFIILKEWLPTIIESTKKDLKNEHLRKDLNFCKLYLSGKNYSKASTEELVQAYSKALLETEQAEELAEFIFNRWLLKNSEVYAYFESKLSEINPNFSEIEEISDQQSNEIINEAIVQFGAPKTYLFSVINSVVFPEHVYQDLSQKAKTEAHRAEQEAQQHEEKLSIDNMKMHYDQKVARLTDKYEKKLAGLQKKYTTDTDSLKKQLAHLQRKLSAC